MSHCTDAWWMDGWMDAYYNNAQANIVKMPCVGRAVRERRAHICLRARRNLSHRSSDLLRELHRGTSRVYRLSKSCIHDRKLLKIQTGEKQYKVKFKN